MTEPKTPKKRKRRWISFNLRTLLVVVTIFGIFVGPELYRQSRQRQAVQILRSQQFTSVHYDYQLKKNLPYEKRDWKAKFPPVRSKVASFTQWAFQTDFFNPVLRLYVADDTESSIALISKLPHLKWLQIGEVSGPLTGRKITSLSPIAKCHQLEYLAVGNWFHLTANGSAGFKGTGVILLPYDITREDMKIIGTLRRLRVLAIGGPNVTDESLNELSKLKSLEYLYLSHAEVTAVGKTELQQALPNVNIIELSYPSIDYSVEIQSKF